MNGFKGELNVFKFEVMSRSWSLWNLISGLIRLQEIFTLSILPDVKIKLRQIDVRNPQSFLDLFTELKDAGEYRILVDCHVTHIHILLKKVKHVLVSPPQNTLFYMFILYLYILNFYMFYRQCRLMHWMNTFTFILQIWWVSALIFQSWQTTCFCE